MVLSLVNCTRQKGLRIHRPLTVALWQVDCCALKAFEQQQVQEGHWPSSLPKSRGWNSQVNNLITWGWGWEKCVCIDLIIPHVSFTSSPYPPLSTRGFRCPEFPVGIPLLVFKVLPHRFVSLNDPSFNFACFWMSYKYNHVIFCDLLFCSAYLKKMFEGYLLSMYGHWNFFIFTTNFPWCEYPVI